MHSLTSTHAVSLVGDTAHPLRHAHVRVAVALLGMQMWLQLPLLIKQEALTTVLDVALM